MISTPLNVPVCEGAAGSVPFAVIAPLRSRPERRQRRRGGSQHEKLAAPHSMVSSARASSAGGIVRPRALAVFAGQGVGLVKDIKPAAEVIRDLIEGAEIILS